MRIHLLLTSATLALMPTLSSAEGTTADRRGDHPAVAVQRLHAARTYDYASTFYPHPAKLYLRPKRRGRRRTRQTPPHSHANRTRSRKVCRSRACHRATARRTDRSGIERTRRSPAGG